MMWWEGPELAPTGAAAELLSLMQDISESSWYAGWLLGLEFELWRMAVSGKGGEYGHETVTDDMAQKLKTLAEQAGGWWMWRDETEFGLAFVKMPQWLELARAAPKGT